MMKQLLKEIALFYAIGGIAVGILFGTAKKVTAKFNGHDLPAPRITSGIIAGMFWPVALVQSIWR